MNEKIKKPKPPFLKECVEHIKEILESYEESNDVPEEFLISLIGSIIIGIKIELLHKFEKNGKDTFSMREMVECALTSVEKVNKKLLLETFEKIIKGKKE